MGETREGRRAGSEDFLRKLELLKDPQPTVAVGELKAQACGSLEPF